MTVYKPGIESDKGEVGEKAQYIDIERTNSRGQSSGKRTAGHIEGAECGRVSSVTVVMAGQGGVRTLFEDLDSSFQSCVESFPFPRPGGSQASSLFSPPLPTPLPPPGVARRGRLRARRLLVAVSICRRLAMTLKACCQCDKIYATIRQAA